VTVTALRARGSRGLASKQTSKQAWLGLALHCLKKQHSALCVLCVRNHTGTDALHFTHTLC